MTILHIGSLNKHPSPSSSHQHHLTSHPVLFKFRPDTETSIREKFITELKTLKKLPCVKSQRLVVGGPSITDPASKSKGFQYALVSYHDDRGALDAYQASSEHERYVSLIVEWIE